MEQRLPPPPRGFTPMRKTLFALLLAFVAPSLALAQSSYPPDYSDTATYDPHLWRPVTATGNYVMNPTDFVVIANCSSNCQINLPAHCQSGWIRRIVNQSLIFQADGITPAAVVTVVPAPGDKYASGAAPQGGPGSYPKELAVGTTRFLAVGEPDGSCAWTWQ
jgi:hypothetical protein